MMSKFLCTFFTISPTVPKHLCDPEPHNLREVWTQLQKKRRH